MNWMLLWWRWAPMRMRTTNTQGRGEPFAAVNEDDMNMDAKNRRR
jgi:hypothetical protein